MPIILSTGMKIGAGVAGAIILALLVALTFTRASLNDVKHERDKAVMQLSVSNGSVNRLQAEITRMNDEQKALANSDENAKNATRQRLEYIEAIENVRQAAIDRLNDSAEIIRKPENAITCTASDALLGDWK